MKVKIMKKKAKFCYENCIQFVLSYIRKNFFICVKLMENYFKIYSNCAKNLCFPQKFKSKLYIYRLYNGKRNNLKKFIKIFH